MEQIELRAFLEKAGSQLAGIRGGLLLAAQDGFSVRDIEAAARRVKAVEAEAAARGLHAVSGFGDRLNGLAASGSRSANAALDAVASAEAALLQFSLRSGEFLDDVEDLVETSFGETKNDAVEPAFEIDDETLDIFREEAETLLANISTNLKHLAGSPSDTNALWEIRRNAHTFKGAAGIVGFKTASTLAHRVEDLLDKLVELRRAADPQVLELLANVTDRLTTITAGIEDESAAVAAAVDADFDAVLASLVRTHANGRPAVPATHKPSGDRRTKDRSPTPIVRVSLERLDELITLSRRLGQPNEDISRLADEISQRLVQLRMVRFGTLETRLARAVHVTCHEEAKKAEFVIRGGDTEIDTQVIDALIEPLLHLLKNAVVHGLESAETRRLLGKAERGRIEISAAADASNVVLTVSDDGSGISIDKLVQKAIDRKIVSADIARTLSETDAVELIFHRGLTTADSLSMNAGRGVGMSIVRQSIESRGGSLGVASSPLKGTTFTISLPVVTHPKPAATGGSMQEAADVPLVLVVDDSSSIRLQTVRCVEANGFRAAPAANAAEALELLLNGLEPQLILSDVEMPNMNGWEFLEYVKSDQNFGDVPVVMVTSLGDDKYKQMASRLGASDYIVKPFGVKELERVLEKFCAVAV